MPETLSEHLQQYERFREEPLLSESGLYELMGFAYTTMFPDALEIPSGLLDGIIQNAVPQIVGIEG